MKKHSDNLRKMTECCLASVATGGVHHDDALAAADAMDAMEEALRFYATRGNTRKAVDNGDIARAALEKVDGKA